ncbi:MAG: pgaC [Nitrososphaeraceae archaeon]|jgi:glycosyltransferase involved in cell wall biosynthesis|nr:pgaC [Nitrososphaeraceae archaeon]
MGSYFVILTCRNSESIIAKSIESIINQSVKPLFIIVINDGSTDETSQILSRYETNYDNFYIINNPDLGYDVTRVVKNWNSALEFVYNHNLQKTTYHMIATDDTIYPPQYSERIIKIMDEDISLACVSGDYGDNKSIMPHGAGRFIRNTFFQDTRWKGFYPDRMGYEAAILFEAIIHRFKYTVIPNLKFEHERPLGTGHKFYTFGASMKSLGYHPLYVLGRFLKNFVTGKETGRYGSFYMLYHYLIYRPDKEGFNSLYEKDFRSHVRSIQRVKILKMFGKR